MGNFLKNIIPDNLKSLFEISGEKIIKLIKYPDETRHLPLEDEVKDRLICIFKDLVETDYIHLKEMVASASGYVVLENEVAFGKPLSKTDLCVIKSN